MCSTGGDRGQQDLPPPISPLRHAPRALLPGQRGARRAARLRPRRPFWLPYLTVLRLRTRTCWNCRLLHKLAPYCQEPAALRNPCSACVPRRSAPPALTDPAFPKPESSQSPRLYWAGKPGRCDSRRRCNVPDRRCTTDVRRHDDMIQALPPSPRPNAAHLDSARMPLDDGASTVSDLELFPLPLPRQRVMCLHRSTWGESVTVEKPTRLRRRLADTWALLATHHLGAGVVRRSAHA